jgi:hypothetical protein
MSPNTAKITSANNTEDIYFNDYKEADFRRRGEKEKTKEEANKDHRDEEGKDEDEEDKDEDKAETVPVIPQKRKMGKDANKPTSKPLFLFYIL